MVFAQSENENPEKEPQTTFVYKANKAGDQFVKLNLAVNFPIKPANLQSGGTGTLGYGNFITDSIILGFSASFSYDLTLGRNVYYSIPLMLSAAYQFTLHRFEFPVTLNAGGSIQTYLDRVIISPVIEPEIGAYYRITSDWSAGIQGGVFIIPQIFRNSKYNYTGIIPDIQLCARYHF